MLGVDDVERLRAELPDDAPRHDRPDSLDEPGAEILLDTLQRCRCSRLVALDLELLAITGVHPPGAFHLQDFAGSQGGEASDGRHEAPLTGDFELNDGITVLVIVVGDALHNALHGDNHVSSILDLINSPNLRSINLLTIPRLMLI